MNRLQKKLENRVLRKNRIRSRVHGDASRPRLSVTISNIHITAQLIDDESHRTLAYVTTVGRTNLSGTMTEKAAIIGTEVAKKAKTAKITKVVFDRNGKLYHGRIKALADAAREGGLEF